MIFLEKLINYCIKFQVILVCFLHMIIIIQICSKCFYQKRTPIQYNINIRYYNYLSYQSLVFGNNELFFVERLYFA